MILLFENSDVFVAINVVIEDIFLACVDGNRMGVNYHKP
jgi:hypothetical protein